MSHATPQHGAPPQQPPPPQSPHGGGSADAMNPYEPRGGGATASADAQAAMFGDLNVSQVRDGVSHEDLVA